MKRSSTTLYTTDSDVHCHRTRLVVAIKGVAAHVVTIDPLTPPEEFIELNPSMALPLLVDRELVLNEAKIIIEYFDERFPHPSLLPVYPVSRAQFRLMMHRIEQDWYPLIAQIEQKVGEEADDARRALLEQILKLEPVFKEQPFFMSPELSVLDCSIAPVLWRLRDLGVVLPDSAQTIKDYAARIFDLDAFQASLTERELEMQELIDDELK